MFDPDDPDMDMIPVNIFKPMDEKFHRKHVNGEWLFQGYEPAGCYKDKVDCHEHKMFLKSTFDYTGDKYSNIYEVKTQNIGSECKDSELVPY